MRRLSAFAGLVIALFTIQSCEKNETGETIVTIKQNTVKDLPGDTIVAFVNGQPVGAGKYTFFSFETNAIVPSTDSASTKWDLGFRGSTIIINGGNSGPGQGGAFVFTGTFDELKKVPSDSTFQVDNAPSSYAIPIGSNKGWYVYNQQTLLLTPIPGRVLVIKTAMGKYAIVEILNYYKGGVTPAVSASNEIKFTTQRFYTFRYAYQSDGSKNF
jgi:hypothetical protein